MVEYPQNPAQHQSQVEVAKSYIEKGAEKRADKYKVLEKLDKNTAGEITNNVDKKFKISDYVATSFTDAVASHFYGNNEGYKGLSHDQRNVVLNVYLALASQGLDVNVCHPNDEWKFDLEGGTFEATLDGKKVSGKLEYLSKKEHREKVVRETKGELSALKTRITAEAQNVLASETDSTVERTTEARKAIEIGSLSNLMATLGNMEATGFQERKALLGKELTDGATKDQLVDDTITGINHYLELAGAGDQKINPQNGEGYKGTVEQNKAWIKFIKDVLSKDVPDYLEKKKEEEVGTPQESSEESAGVVTESVEATPFEFNFIENGAKPKKGVEERKDLKDFLVDHFEAVSKEVGGITYGKDVEVIWSEEGGQRTLEVKWKEIKGVDMPENTLIRKSRKVLVEAGGIFHGWGKSWEELVGSMKTAMTMPDNFTTTPASEIWAEKASGAAPESTLELSQMKEYARIFEKDVPKWLLRDFNLEQVEVTTVINEADRNISYTIALNPQGNTEIIARNIDLDSEQGNIEDVYKGILKTHEAALSKYKKSEESAENPLADPVVPRLNIADEGLRAGPGDEAAGIGEVGAARGGPGGTLERPAPVPPTAPEISVPKLESTYDYEKEEEGRKERDKKRSQDALIPVRDSDLGQPEEPLGEPNLESIIERGLKINLGELGIGPDYHFEDVTIKGIEFGPAQVKDLAKSEYRFDGFVNAAPHGKGAKAVSERYAEEWKGHVLVFESKEKVDGRPRVRMEVQSQAYVDYWGAPKVRVWTEGEKELHSYDSDRHDVMGELEKFHKNPA